MTLGKVTTDDTERHSFDVETLNDDTDQSISTYDPLDGADFHRFDTSQSELWDAFDRQSTMSGAHEALKPWPTFYSYVQDHHPRDATRPHYQQHEQQLTEQASTATLRAHYDPGQESLNVSQQTSASSVRDMALRKGRPSILRKEEKPDKRPLKSALKSRQSELRGQAAQRPQYLYPLNHQQQQQQPEERSRFSRFGSLFSRHSSSHKSAQSPQVSRNSSTTSAISSTYGSSAAPRRKRSIGWNQPLQQYDTSRTDSVQSDLSEVIRQAKLAEDDVFEKAKVNVRRPPKGITNWFDGIDISSDEDLPAPVQEHAQEALPSTFSTFADKKDRLSHNAKYSGISNEPQLSKPERVLGRKTGAGDRYQHTADEASRNEYHDYRTATPKASAQTKSRHGHDHDSSQSTSCTVKRSDAEFDDPAGRHHTTRHHDGQIDMASDHHATNTTSRRPDIPPRRLQNSQIATHNAYHVNERPQLVQLSTRPHRTETQGNDSRRNASYKDRERLILAQSRGGASSGYDESNGGVSVDPEDSHMMAVSEEEMALLEMMRNKRAAMQQSSFSQGYQQALQKEHDQLMQRRIVAQQSALRMLQDREEKEYLARKSAALYHETDEKEALRLHKLQRQETDRAQRLEKFLAMDTSLAVALGDATISQDRDLVTTWALPKHEFLDSQDVNEKHGRERTTSRSFSRRDLDHVGSGRALHNKHDRYTATQDTNYAGSGKGLHDKHDRLTAAQDTNYAITFLDPSERADTASLHRQASSRGRLSNVKFESPSAGLEGLAQRRSQALAYQEGLYMLKKQSAAHFEDTQRPLHSQVRSTTFLRSISDYQPIDDGMTSQESFSASIVSPMTPSSIGAGHATKIPGAVNGEDAIYFDTSSPESTFSRQQSMNRQSKHMSSALAMFAADRSRSSHRQSMASSNSAGEDVLAAWAELGGNEGMLPFRRTRVW